MNILVTGSGGQLGSQFRALASSFPQGRFFFYDHQSLDITSREQVDAVLRHTGCDVVVNCAALTSVDRAEAEPEAFFRVNRDGAGVLAGSAGRHGALLVHVSTYYVFDGCSSVAYRTTDAVSPLGVYGVSKWEGEELVRKSGASHLIVRTGWLYSRYGENFVKTMLRLGRRRERLEVVDDRLGSPVHAADLALAILRMLAAGAVVSGRHAAATYHYANEGACSWYELAAAIMEFSGLPCRVVPVDSSRFPSVGPRPRFSVLDSAAFRRDWNLEIPHWKDALAGMIATLPPQAD